MFRLLQVYCPKMFSILASTPVQLKGLDFVEWKPFVWQRSLESNNIAMMFKTVEPSGVLLYIGNETKYLIIELFRGRLMVGTHMDKCKSSWPFCKMNQLVSGFLQN